MGPERFELSTYGLPIFKL